MKKVVNVKVENKEWEKAKDDAFEKLNKKVKIDGFRQGKAPRNIYEKNYGTGDIVIEAANKIINNGFDDALNEAGFNPVVEPKVDIIKCDDEALEFNYVFIGVTDIKLGQYKNLGIKKEVAKVTKKEVAEEIKKLLDTYAEIVEKEGKVAKGDIAILDYEGFKDGVAFAGGKAENYQLEIGSKTFIPGFEDGLIGMKKDEEKDLELTFPEDYHSEDLKGAKVIFKVKIKEIKERKVPDMDTEFFEDLAIPEVKSKDDLEKQMEIKIKEHKQFHIDDEYIFKVLDKACENMTIDIEDEIIEREATAEYEEFVEKLEQKGMDEEIYFKFAGTTKEEAQEEIKKTSKTRILYRYLLNEVIKEEKIKVTDKEVKNKIEEFSKFYNITEEEVIKEFGSVETIKYDIMLNKAVEVIQSNE